MSLDHHFAEPTAIRTNLGAIFVSLELSRSTWLITSLSPGGGEKMSKHGLSAGNIAALLARCYRSSEPRLGTVCQAPSS
jgi:transposase